MSLAMALVFRINGGSKLGKANFAEKYFELKRSAPTIYHFGFDLPYFSKIKGLKDCFNSVLSQNVTVNSY